MKKSFLIMIWVIGVVSLAAITYAQNEHKSPAQSANTEESGQNIDKPMMRGMGKMGDPRNMMKRMKMMSFSMVATTDGGVAILDGDILTKYDKDLNVVKSVKVERNTNCIQGMPDMPEMPCGKAEK